MSSIDRRLLRAACRLYAAYGVAAPDRGELDLPENAWDEVRAALGCWKKASERNWKGARCGSAKHSSPNSSTSAVNSTIALSHSNLSDRQPYRLRVLYGELAATAAEFDGVELAKSELSITTEVITLDEVELGPFRIRLHLHRLGSETPYSVTALEPNPAASCSDTTHPHVNGDRLCPGEGRGAIAAALADGRLFDFFTIVDRILHTYAAGSAYVELDRWDGVACHDCDSTLDDDEAYSCSHCEERLCGDCLVSCGGCSDGYCSGCIERCSRCEEYSCSGCLKRLRSIAAAASAVVLRGRTL